MNNLKKENYKLVKVKKTIHYKSQRKKLVALLRECKQLQNAQAEEKA